MGDFTGFSFGGIHSDTLGIIRVSGGDRYTEQLQPEIKDITAEVPGMNGEYYFGSTYGARTFDIEFAFDSLTEQQFRNLRKIFGTKETKPLIFDERPYKTYMAKIESPIELSYVCFDELVMVETTVLGIGNEEHDVMRPSGEYQTVYKGEGSISFKCYFPFAKSTFKVLPQQNEQYYEGSENWAISSGILSSLSGIDAYDSANHRITVYNAGDVDTGFRLYIPFSALNQSVELIYQDYLGYDTASLQLKAMTKKNDSETGIMIDTDKGLITGVILSGTNYNLTSNLYNEYVQAGYFFRLPPNRIDTTSIIRITNGASGIAIFYDYLYF